MMNEKNKRTDVLDLTLIFRKIWEHKKLYIRTLSITFVLSCAVILFMPRYYTATVRMAPEMAGAEAGGALGSIASSLGFNIGEMQTTDAISPLLYPDVIATNDFVVDLLQIPVTTIDGSIQCSYYDYMSKYYKEPFWTVAKSKAIGWVKSFFPSDEDPVAGDAKINPFQLSRFQTAIFARITKNISCVVDKKTGVISITVQAQDALVAATMADSVQAHLQDYIIKYRTSKARVDVEHYQQLVSQTKLDYEQAVNKYSEYCDSHQNVILQSYISERDKLENDMQTRFSTYSAMLAQLETAKAKLQERTPAFTMLQSPTVPVKPAGPKRMIFVLGMLMLVAIVQSIYVVREELFIAFK